MDVASGAGLDEALEGVEAVVDASNPPEPESLGAMTERLLAAEARAGVGHHVLLSIVGVDRIEGNPHYVQPVAAADVGDVLAEVAAGPPRGRAPELAGPETQDLVDMARRSLAARGRQVRLVPTWRSGLFGPDAAGEALLPGADARLAPTTFEDWLATA